MTVCFFKKDGYSVMEKTQFLFMTIDMVLKVLYFHYIQSRCGFQYTCIW